MSKKQRKQEKAFRRQTAHQPRSRFTGIDHRGLSREQRFEYARKNAEESDRQFKESLQKLEELLRVVDPLSVLSSFAFHELGYISRNSKLAEHARFFPHHFELLQALTLRHQQDTSESIPLLMPDYQVIRDLVLKTTQAFSNRRIDVFKPSMSPEEFHRAEILADIQEHTQKIRNWGYPPQMSRFITGLFDPLDAAIEQQIGVSVNDLMAMWSQLSAISNDRIIMQHQLVQPILQATAIRSAVEAFRSSFPELHSTSGEVIKLIGESNLRLREAKEKLVDLSHLRLPDIYTFTFNDFLKAYHKAINPNDLQQVLDSWAYSFGELKDHDPQSFLLANPVWKRPLIRIGDNRFFWPYISMFLGFGLELMENLIEPHAKLKAKYDKRPGTFLEDALERLFKTGFPSAKIYRDSKWYHPATNKETDNDLLVLIDSYAIVIEAKAGKVTAPALRGAPDRLEKKIEELVIKPSEQANNFAEYLQRNRGLHEFKTEHGKPNKVDTSSIYHFVPLSVTRELLGDLISHLPNLQKAGFIPINTKLAPTISFADLENIFEILEGTCEKLHYLARRAQFESRANYFGDEADLLAFYLDTGFNIGQREFAQSDLFLYGFSKNTSEALVRYFMSQAGPMYNAPKPSLRLTKWFRDTLRKLEEQRMPHWTEIGYLLLNAAYSEQERFERRFGNIQQLMMKHKPAQGYVREVVQLTGPPQRRGAIVGVAYKGITDEQLDQWIKNKSTEAMEHTQSDRVLVIGIDVEQLNYPYSIIDCVFKPGKD